MPRLEAVIHRGAFFNTLLAHVGDAPWAERYALPSGIAEEAILASGKTVYELCCEAVEAPRLKREDTELIQRLEQLSLGQREMVRAVIYAIAEPWWLDQRNACDTRSPFEFDLLAKCIEERDITRVEGMIDECVAGTAGVIHESMTRLGISYAVLSKALGLNIALTWRALSEHPEKALPFETLHTLCTEVYQCSVSDLLLSREWPCRLPRKYGLLLRARKLTAEECRAAAERLRAELPPPTPHPYTNRNIRDNIACRIREVSGELGVVPVDLVENSAMRRRFRGAADGLENMQTFRGRFWALMGFAFGAGISIDYLLLPDYARHARQFVSADGRPIQLRSCERKLLSTFLICPDIEAVNRALGQFYAST